MQIMAKMIPNGAQLLTLPIDDCKLNAGYKASKYLATYKIQHYGWDLGSVSGSRPLRGMGHGVVIAAGMDGANAKDRLGNCLVVIYPEVLCRDGSVRDLSCRMFHLESIAVKAGQEITSETILGRYGATGNRLRFRCSRGQDHQAGNCGQQPFSFPGVLLGGRADAGPQSELGIPGLDDRR